MGVVKLTRRKGRVDRVPIGQTPDVELQLEEDEQIVGFELRDMLLMRDRKTVDWYWTAFIATRL